MPAFVNLFPTWSHEGQGRMLDGPLALSSLPGAAQGQLASAASSAIGISTEVATRARKTGSCRSTVELQRPQNIRPSVCMLSATLSLFGDKPRCHPLEMTKEIKAQMGPKDTGQAVLASEAVPQVMLF